MSENLKDKMLRAAADPGKSALERQQALVFAKRMGATAEQAAGIWNLAPHELGEVFAATDTAVAYAALVKVLPQGEPLATAIKAPPSLQDRALSLSQPKATQPSGDIPRSNALALRRSMDEKLGKSAVAVISAARALDPVLQKLGVKDVETDVGLVLDRTGSMAKHYANRSMHVVTDRFLALGHRLQPQGMVNTYAFGVKAHRTGVINVDTYRPGHVDRMLDQLGGELDNGTYYVPALEMLTEDLVLNMGKPTMATIVTDGEPHDGPFAGNVIEAMADKNIFVQFIALGEDVEAPSPGYRGNYGLLNTWAQKLPHVGFIALKQGDSLSDGAFFERLITQYANWVLRHGALGAPSGTVDLMSRAAAQFDKLKT